MQRTNSWREVSHVNTTFTHTNTEATLLFARDVITMSQTW